MKNKLLACLLIITFIISLLPAQAFALGNDNQTSDTITGLGSNQNSSNQPSQANGNTIDYLIGYKSDNSKAKIESRGKIKHQYKYTSTTLASLTETDKLALEADPDIDYIEPNASVQSQDAEQASWGYTAIKADEAQSDGYLGQDVMIAVLDSGVDLNHPDLKTKPGVSFTGGSYQDDNGHGTQVTGIIEAQLNDLGVKGISPLAQTYPVKVLGSNGTGTYDAVIQGIEWAINNKMNIISMSFGGPTPSRSLEKTVNDAANRGLLLIAAAGNMGNSETEDILYPAKYNSVIAVGSVGQEGNVSSFSSAGPELELLAPGEGILTTQLGGTYGNFSGTSIATAHVTGVAALVMAANPSLENQEVRAILQSTTTPLGAIQVVNAENAVLAAQQKTVNNPANLPEQAGPGNQPAPPTAVNKPASEQKPPGLANRDNKPPVPEVIEVSGGSHSEAEDYIYGHSPYYNALKKAGRLDLLPKDGQGQPASEKAEDQKQSQSKVNNNQIDANLQQMIAQGFTDQDQYNTLIGPSAMNGVNEQKYSAWTNTGEIISPQTGDLTIKQTDLNLPGRNGLDLNISRIYQSSQSVFGDRKIDSNGCGYNDYSTYYLKRYALGLGWAFGFPSVQVEQGGQETELYYHTGTGAVYHVMPGATYSNLEKYYNNDAVFNSNDTSFTYIK